MDKLDFTKIENFRSSKDKVMGMKRQATMMRKYLQNSHLIKDFYGECIKKAQNPIARKQTIQLEKGQST